MDTANGQGAGGVVAVKTDQTLIVGVYGENATAGEVAKIVEELADYLISVGYVSFSSVFNVYLAVSFTCACTVVGSQISANKAFILVCVLVLRVLLSV